jgi:hypothetical protein
MSTKQNSNPKPTIVDEAKSKIDEMVNSKPVKETKVKAKEAVNKVIDTLQKSYEKTIESIDNGDAEQNLKDSIKSGKQKTSKVGRKIADSVIDTIDVFKDELESTDSKTDNEGKIQKSKKQLKHAKKNIKDRI